MYCAAFLQRTAQASTMGPLSLSQLREVRKQLQSQMGAFFCSESQIQRAALSDAQTNYRNLKPDTLEEFLQDLDYLAAEVGGSTCSAGHAKCTGGKKLIEVSRERNIRKNYYFHSKLENRGILVE